MNRPLLFISVFLVCTTIALAATLVISGDFTSTKVVSGADVYDATNANAFVEQGTNNTGFRVESSPNNAKWIGGHVFGQGDNKTLSWRKLYDQGNGAGLLIRDSHHFTIDGLYIEWSWDGIRPAAEATGDYLIIRSWLNNWRDDGIEADHIGDYDKIRVENCLLEDGHTFSSNRRGGDATGPTPAYRLEFVNNVMSLGLHLEDREKREYAWSGPIPGYVSGQMHKSESNGTNMTLLYKDNIVKLVKAPATAESVLNLLPGNATIASGSGGNTFVWLGGSPDGLTMETIDGVLVPVAFDIDPALWDVTSNGNTWTTARNNWVSNVWENGGTDTTAPTVDITAPTNGSTVMGTISVTASASDNVGVVGVQFKLDGGNLGSEDTSSPYSVSWNTTSASNGSHNLTAVARDAAGNTKTSSTVNVTVDNGGSVPSQATNPVPSSGATGLDLNTDISWTAGSGASTHDVYFGTDSTPDSTEFKGNQTGTTYDPGTLAGNTTYYWRIDEKNANGTTTGAVWSFTTMSGPPSQATNPSPSNGATGVDTGVNLSWTAGSGAVSHDVYFGTDSTPDSTEFQGNQTGTTFVPDTVNGQTTYYWRIDEVNSAGTTTGAVWSFTTDGGGGVIGFRAASSATTGGTSAPSLTVNKPSGVVGGDFMLAGISVSNDDATITAPSGWTLVRSITDILRLSIYRKMAGTSEPSNYTWNSSINRRLCGGIVAFSGVDPANPIQVENGAAHTTSASSTHSTPTISVSGSDAWLVSIFADRRDTGSTWTPPSGTTERVDVRTTDTVSNPSLEINTVGPVSSGNKTHTATASGSSANAGMEIIALKANDGGGSSGSLPTKATNPSPANSATGVDVFADLSWTSAASGTESHDVYFGTDSTPDSTEFKGNQLGNTYDPGTLANSTTYYWRIDEVNINGTTTGDVWSFTTASGGGGGGTIAFRAASNATTGASLQSSLAVSKPSGVVSGDFMIAAISVSNSDATITAPSGWTLVRTITDIMRLSIYRKTAGGSEPSSYTWSSSISRRLCGGIVAFSGVSSSAPIQVENGIAESGTGISAHSTPTISTTGSTAWLVSVFADRRDTGSTWTPPSGTTERVDVRTTDTVNNPSLEMNTVGPVSSGNKTHTATASGNSANAGMEIIAIQP